MPYLKVVPQRSLGEFGQHHGHHGGHHGGGGYWRGGGPWWGGYPGYPPGIPCLDYPCPPHIAAVPAEPLYQGFSGFGEAVPFTQAANPVAAFISGLQTALHVPVTGKWNRATHDALGAYVTTLNSALGDVGDPLPPWGTDSAAVANLAVLMLSFMGVEQVWNAPAARATEFAAAWGIPATTVEEMNDWQLANIADLKHIGPRTIEEIVVTESSRCGTGRSWMSLGLIGTGVLLAGLGIGYVTWGRG